MRAPSVFAVAEYRPPCYQVSSRGCGCGEPQTLNPETRVGASVLHNNVSARAERAGSRNKIS